MTAEQDFAVIRFPHFAEAASARASSIFVVAAQRVSSIRSFTGVGLAETETVFSSPANLRCIKAAGAPAVLR